MRWNVLAGLIVSVLILPVGGVEALADDATSPSDSARPQSEHHRSADLVLPHAEILNLDTSEPNRVILKVKNRFGSEDVIHLLSGTRFVRGEREMTVTDLHIGDFVDIDYNLDPRSMERTAVTVTLSEAAVASEHAREKQRLDLIGGANELPKGDPSDAGMKRTYFQDIDAARCAEVRTGITQAAARQLCQGKRYTPFETVRNGFAFALDETHERMFVIPGWMPNPSWTLDFFVAEHEYFYVRYDDERRVALVMRYPIATEPATSVEVLSGKENLITAPEPIPRKP